ncbi:MAG TPA: signal peptide peptidase SppA [Oligoflexia bacterium]|nr:signal peptide peptidase SppA [Oligoflexia bacterium]HMP27086.1 signal peptide peptidase SppA [Oligoflexia bacterium]
MNEYFKWLVKLITKAIVMVIFIPLGIALTVAYISGKSGLSKLDGGEPTVAVITISDIIEDSQEIVRLLYDQIENPKVQGIVLRINSPGGAVAPSQEIYQTVKKLKTRKPIVASMSAVAASGGLYSALGASKIFAAPGTLTGSIGVIIQIPNLSKITEKIGIEMQTIKSGELKDVGNLFREMTPTEKEFLQKTIDQTKEQFYSAIIESRGISRDKLLKFADGRIILGSDAKDFGLVDEIGDLYEAAREVFLLLGQPLEEGKYPKLYEPTDKLIDIKQLLKSLSFLPAISVKRGIRLMYLSDLG